MEYPQAQTGQVPMETNLQENQHWPLSGKPYFDIVLAKSHVKPLYQMVSIPFDYLQSYFHLFGSSN